MVADDSQDDSGCVQITEGFLQPSVLARDLFSEHGAPVWHSTSKVSININMRACLCGCFLKTVRKINHAYLFFRSVTLSILSDKLS